MANKYITEVEGGVKARGDRLDISPRHAVEVCSNIRGKKLARAKAFLENVIEKKEYVLLRKYKKQVPHRTGGKPGRYHVKASREILKLLKNAEANAEDLDKDTEKLVVAHAAAQRGPTYNRRRPKGRMKSSNIDTVSVEIILKEA